MNIVQAAKKYIEAGISVIPCNEEKKCCIPSWTPYMSRLMTDAEASENFSSASMIALVCGKINKGIEVIDVDLKYHLEPKVFWEQLITAIEKEIAVDFVTVKTMNNGFHLYFRCDTVGRNQKLASRLSTPEELIDKPHMKQRCFIETRADGGYIIVPPSPKYTKVKGSLLDIPVITAEQRSDLINICRSFDLIPAQAIYTASEIETKQNYLLSPLDDYNASANVIGLLQEKGWSIYAERGDHILLTRPDKKRKTVSASYHKGSKLTYIFSSNTEFDNDKAYMPYQILAKYNYGDNYREMAKDLLSKGFGVPNKSVTVNNFAKAKQVFNTEGEGATRKYCETLGYSTKVTDAIILKAKSNEDLLSKTIFWYLEDEKCKISPIIFRNFLEHELNLSLYYGSDSNGVYRIVTCNNSRLREITTAEIKEAIVTWLNNNVEIVSKTECSVDMVLSALASNEKLFSDGSMEWLRRNDKQLLKDTATAGYYYFSNCVVKVEKEGVKMLSYTEGLNNKVIWEKQVIKRDFFEYNTDMEFNWKRFLFKVCGESDKKFIYLCSLIGYCIHRFKDDAFAKAVMFAEEVEDPKQGGGAGKGVLIKALQYCVGGMTVDGESFTPDGNFAFQRYELGSPFICINDAAKNTQWDKWKSIITDGLTVEVKNKNQLYVPFEDAPKILVTTQYGIDMEKMFLVRRFILFTFEPYFNHKYTPFDEFGEMFFKWTPEQWMQFYNFMFECVSLYIGQGIKPLESSGLVTKTWNLRYGNDLKPYLESSALKECYISELYEDFLKVNDIDRQQYKRALFENGVKAFIADKNWQLIRDTTNKNKLKIISKI